ncbi:hypothetical protein [Aphanothece sacrum]|uniref:Nucleoside deoxyribosyltransferase n=1 Tax=Aphanothece sacrum FPU1 TaxID=1920663 RepID=A0A401IJV1_APHSA|nr:hypothetical protein [Aphanothece sacrum]GBF81557.1 nucleoside deoxyribosyltransferase [Aphanothece sacrum FPU1]GBF86986.1 nucleoside deoxyribosyltransferase [Aphanothece sacrum FPU3]
MTLTRSKWFGHNWLKIGQYKSITEVNSTSDNNVNPKIDLSHQEILQKQANGQSLSYIDEYIHLHF